MEPLTYVSFLYLSFVFVRWMASAANLGRGPLREALEGADAAE
jgi:hypothetical protein